MTARTPSHTKLAALLAMGVASLGVGCRQNVYHQLYAEQNAREIRALEDRIFEFDAEYRDLENRYLAKEHENEVLRQRLAQSMANAKSSGKPSPSKPQGSTKPKFDDVDEKWELPDVVVPTPDPKANAPVEPTVPKGSSEDALKIIDPPNKNVGDLPAPKKDATNKDATPERMVPGAGLTPPAAPPNPSTDKPSNNPTLNNSLPSNPSFQAPGINPAPGLTPPLLQPAPSNPVPGNVNDRDRDRADASSRIVIPEYDQFVRPASALVSQPSNTTDQRIVEIAFHPSLCRSINLDDNPQDDGVYVVLQPRNAMGQFAEAAGDVTVIAVDPTKPKERERIARWTYTADDFAKTLHASGASQGYHLPLRWQADVPQGDHVQIFVRVVLADGKTLVSERKVMLHHRDSMQSVWTPRANAR